MENIRNEELKTLVGELKKQQKQKWDVIVPGHCLLMKDKKIIIDNQTNHDELTKILIDSGISVSNTGQQVQLKQMDTIREHICEKLKIPRQYFDKCLNDDSDILDKNVTHWFRSLNKTYLLRTFVDKRKNTGYARALLSDQFKIIDHWDILMTVLETVKEVEQREGIRIEIKQCDMTSRNMYIQFDAPDVSIEAKHLLRNYKPPGGKQIEPGEYGVSSGFIIGNSETGHGSQFIAPRILIAACQNGQIITEDAYKKRHLGTQLDEYTSIKWSEETMSRNMELIKSQVKDAIRTYLNPNYLGKIVRSLEEYSNQELEHPVEAVRNVCKFINMTENRTNDVIDYFVKSGDASSFGVSQAITYLAHEVEDADLQYELEEQAVNVLPKIKQMDKKDPVVQQNLL